MINYTLQISLTPAILLAVTTVLAAVAIIIYVRRIWRVASAVKRQTALASIQATAQDGGGATAVKQSTHGTPPPVSVIVYTRDSAENMAVLLPQLLAQKYDPGFEIIVVNDGQSDLTANLVTGLQARHHNLYMTFAPEGARNVSRKKLAVMIGIKAAHNPVAVNITGDTQVPGSLWLSRMARHFADPAVQLVTGYAMPPAGDTAPGRRTRTFDHVADAVTWLGSALKGKPRRGTEFNLAYTRDAFFANKGFSRSLNLCAGDDDIFVTEIARPGNSAVEVSRQAMTVHTPYDPRAAHHALRQSHAFTGRRLPQGAQYTMALGRLCTVAALCCAAATAVAGLPNLFAASLAAVPALTLLVLTLWAWRRAVKALSAKPPLLTLPWLWLTYPWRQLLTAVRAARHTDRHYSWHHN